MEKFPIFGKKAFLAQTVYLKRPFTRRIENRPKMTPPLHLYGTVEVRLPYIALLFTPLFFHLLPMAFRHLLIVHRPKRA